MLTKPFAPIPMNVQPYVFVEDSDCLEVKDCFAPLDAPSVIPAGSHHFGWNSQLTGNPIPLPSVVAREQ